MPDETQPDHRVRAPQERTLRLVAVEVPSIADSGPWEPLMAPRAGAGPSRFTMAAAAPPLPVAIWEDSEGNRFILKPTESGVEAVPYARTAGPDGLDEVEHFPIASEGSGKGGSPKPSSGESDSIEDAIREKLEKAPEELLKMAEEWAVKEAASQLQSLYRQIWGDEAPKAPPKPASQAGLPSLGDVFEDPDKALEKFQEWWRSGGPEALAAESGIDLGIDQAYGLFEDAVGLGDLTDRSSTGQYLSKAALDSFVAPYLKDLIKAQMVSLLKEQFPATFQALDAKSPDNPVKKLRELLGADSGPKFLAARMGDPTSHPGTLASGAGRTLINGKPAVRATDQHTCSADPPNAVRQGNPTIVIEGMLASRLDHETVCTAKLQPPGSNVFYGDATADVLPPSPPSAQSAPPPAKAPAGSGSSGSGGASGGGQQGQGGGAGAEGETDLRNELAGLEARKAELRRQMESGNLTPEQYDRAVDEHAKIENRMSQIHSTLGIDEDPDPQRSPAPPPPEPKPESPKPTPAPVPPVVITVPVPVDVPAPVPDPKPKPMPVPVPTPTPAPAPDSSGGGSEGDDDCSACDCQPPCRMEGTWEVLPHPAELSVSDFKHTQTYAAIAGVVWVVEFKVSGRLKAVLLCQCSCGKHKCRKRINVPFKFKGRTKILAGLVPLTWLTVLRFVRGMIKVDRFIQEFAPQLQIAIHEITNSADRICQGLYAIERALQNLDVAEDWFEHVLDPDRMA